MTLTNKGNAAGNRDKTQHGRVQNEMEINLCWLLPLLLDFCGVVVSPMDPSRDKVAHLPLLGLLLRRGCGNGGNGPCRKRSDPVLRNRGGRSNFG